MFKLFFIYNFVHMKKYIDFNTEKILLFFVCLVIFTTSVSMKPQTEVRYVKITKYKFVAPSTFSEQKLDSLIDALKIKFPHIVKAQAKLESGNFTKPIFTSNNNLFGMRKPTQRCTTAKHGGNFAKYDSWEMSVIDYALFQNKYLKNKSEKEYYAFLNKWYAMDSNYDNKLKEIIYN